MVPLAWGVMVVLTDPSDDIRFSVAPFAEVYPMEKVTGLLPPPQFGCGPLTAAVTVGGLGGGGATVGGWLGVGVGLGVSLGVALGVVLGVEL